MEENNYEHCEIDNNSKNFKKTYFMDEHPWIKWLFIGLLTFLGAFCAFYVVSDWHFKRALSPEYQMRKLDKEFTRQEKQFNQMSKKGFQMQERMEKEINKNAHQFIHVERLENAYRFTIDLKPFNNNPKNVHIKTEGKMLIIDAAGEKQENDRKEIVKYNQAFGFGEDIKTDEITKVHNGNNYIITVPLD